MVADKTFTIQFAKDDDVVCELIEETPESSKYKVTKFNYDSDTCEKTILTITVELSPMTDKEKRSALFYKYFWGHEGSSTDIKITEFNNGRSRRNTK